jgi:DegV family protein with EDD domain
VAGIQVVTDSACDLQPETAAAHGIRVVPLTIRFGDEELVDQRELSTAAFWERLLAGPHLPSTAAPSPGAFREAFEAAAEDGAEGVLCLTLSGGVSATYQSACTAAQAVAAQIRVEVVDTRTLTLGLGLLVLSAAEDARAGASLDELVRRVHERMARTSVLGVVGTLDHLRRGGRIGGAAHLVGSVLAIKPIIEVRDGVVEVESKQRTRAKALAYLVEKTAALAPFERLGVVQGAAEDAEDFVARLVEAVKEPPPLVTVLGPVVGAHAGPGTIGVCAIRRSGG